MRILTKIDEITLLIDDNWTKNKTKKKKEEGKRLYITIAFYIDKDSYFSP